jgi:hypothetical protein
MKTFVVSIALLALTASIQAISTQEKPVTPEVFGQDYAVVSWEQDQINPAVAYSPDSKLFLVAWEDYHWASGAQADIYARMLSLSGAPAADKFGASTPRRRHGETF